MKLRKTLTIGGKAVKLVEEDLRLEIGSPGRGFFRVEATEALSGVVQFSLGHSNQDKDQLFFSGYIEHSHTVDTVTQKIFCREIAAVLNFTHPISLRHPTLNDVLEAYSERTGLVFTVPEQPYATKRVPHFYMLGNGYHGMDQLGAVFGIEKYYWQPQPDGTVWVGSWNHSRWATRPVEIDEKFFTKVTADGTKILAAIPALRPGVFLNGKYLTSVQLEGHEMVIRCENSLNV